MKVLKKVKAASKYCATLKRPLLFVPTMGFLHDGHLALIKRARNEGGSVVVSIYVNPTQFIPGEDFDNYPRDLKRDLSLLKTAEVDAVFVPDSKEIYGDNHSKQTKIIADQKLSGRLCGSSRPGHFDGVVTIVNKMVNIIHPDGVVLGSKDYQQLLIIRKMIADLNMDIKVIPLATVREDDGLALSSRNKYLNSDERKRALILSQSLKIGSDLLRRGEQVKDVKKFLFNSLRSRPNDRLDYLEIVNATNLDVITSYKKRKTLIAIAMYIGDTRLIDNIVC